MVATIFGDRHRDGGGVHCCLDGTKERGKVYLDEKRDVKNQQ